MTRYLSVPPPPPHTPSSTHTLPQDLLKSVRVVKVNCMSVKQPQAIFGQIAEGLLDSRVAKGRSHQEAVVKSLTSSRKMT